MVHLVSARGRRATYGKLLNNGGNAKNRGGLKGEHRLLTLLYVSKLELLLVSYRSTNVEVVECLAVGVEGVVVELDELLCGSGKSHVSCCSSVSVGTWRQFHDILATSSKSTSRVSLSAEIIAFTLRRGNLVLY